METLDCFDEIDCGFVLREVVSRLVRIEHRLELAGVLPLDLDEHSLRFVLENGLPMELELETEPQRRITLEFVNAVSDWLEVHENDESPTLAQLEISLVATNRAARDDVRTVLMYFAQSDPPQWEDVLHRMIARDPLGMSWLRRSLRRG